jgi:uncharacterized membrane protein YsdA (DUF1294 family)/cold shock CspA family protein
MRFEGTIKTWNDDRGFGFIEAAQGGPDVFVHIKAFGVRAGRPQINQRVTFEVEMSPDGKKRARNVELARAPLAARALPRSRTDPPAEWGTASLLAIPAFLIVYAAVYFLWRVPIWFSAFYLVASLICFFAYAIDKSAAVAGRRRISESTLLTIGLIGGWPGAIVAQQVLRHKSSKASFRSAFWGTVVVNMAAFVFINAARH